MLWYKIQGADWATCVLFTREEYLDLVKYNTADQNVVFSTIKSILQSYSHVS